MKPRTLIVCSVLPASLGAVVAGVFAFAAGWTDAALAALVVGTCVSLVVAAVGVIVLFAAVAAVLFRAAVALWTVATKWVQMFSPQDDGSGEDGGEGSKGGEGGCGGEVLYDSGRPSHGLPRILPTLMN